MNRMAAALIAVTMLVVPAGASAQSTTPAPATPAPTAMPSSTPIAGITAPLDVTGGQLLLTSVNYAPPGFGPLTAPDSWLEVVGRVVSGTPDLKALGSSASLTGDGTACMYAANGTDAPFWVFRVKTAMRSFVFTLDGHPIPLDSLLPAK